ncbi:unnamed protein product [Rhizopus stolonifer]
MPRICIGDFDVFQTIGRGSTGTVKYAINRTNGMSSALKIIKRSITNDQLKTVNGRQYSTEDYERELRRIQKNEQRTEQEARMQQLMNHPHLGQIMDTYITENCYYLAMEYIEGDQLLHYVATRGRMSEPESRRFSRQILSALDYMHRNSITHRDLKVENIMLDRHHQNIKIIDFGLSSMFAPDLLLKTFCGSIYFAAPEVLLGEPYQGPELDVWSLGVVIYVMVVGRIPYDGHTLADVQRKIVRADPDYPPHISSNCKDLLCRIFTVRRERIKMFDIMRHPWINKHYASPIENYLPKRVPLHSLLDLDVLETMESIFGSDIKQKIEAVISSEAYHAATSHVLMVQNGRESPYSNLWGLYDDPQTVPSAYHPLCAVYYLLIEKNDNYPAHQVPDSPISTSSLSLPQSPVEPDEILVSLDTLVHNNNNANNDESFSTNNFNSESDNSSLSDGPSLGDIGIPHHIFTAPECACSNRIFINLDV